MLFGEGRSHRRDGIVDAGFVKPDDVHVALDDDGFPSQPDAALVLQKAVEITSFGKKRRFRRVDVLRLVRLLVELSPSETDDLALLVADGKDEPVAEPIVTLLGRAFLRHDEP